MVVTFLTSVFTSLTSFFELVKLVTQGNKKILSFLGWEGDVSPKIAIFGTSQGNTDLLSLSVNQGTYPANNAVTMWSYCKILGNIGVRVMSEGRGQEKNVL